MLNIFEDCSNLTEIVIGNSVTGIGAWAFSGCSALTEVVIPNSVSYIGNYAFLDCIGLTNLEIGNGITTIIYDAFVGCTGLTDLTLNCPEIGAWFKDFSSLKNVTLGNTVTSIGDNAFSNCTGITSIEIPNSVLSIGSDAFSGCTGLAAIIIPNSVTSIGNSAFESCSAMKSLVIGNNVVSIGYYAFSECEGLTSIEIPNSVTTIGYGAFSNCTNMTDLVIGNSVNSIEYGTFQGCSSLKSVEIPNSVISIGEYAFFICSDLSTVKIGNSVTTIGNNAFLSCTNLKSVVIPNSVTNIGPQTFSDCDNLETIYSLITKVFTIGNSTFSEMAFHNATLYVPKGKLASYQGTDYWSKFLNIKEGAPTEVGDLNRSYKLKVSDAGMASMYLDYPVAIPDNDNMLGVFYVCSMNDHILNLRRLKETIPANCGVIVMANQGTFTFKETLMSTDVVEENLLSGTTVKVSTASIPGDVYTLGRGVNSGYMGFHKYTGATLPANKAYLVRNADDEEDDVLVIDRSAFDNLFDSTTGVTKVVIEGEEQPIIYDLQGRRVEHPSKGIYIVNGKKKYIK